MGVSQPDRQVGTAGLRREAACGSAGRRSEHSPLGDVCEPAQLGADRRKAMWLRATETGSASQKDLNSTLKTTGGRGESSAGQETGGPQCLSGHDSTLRSAAEVKNFAANRKATTQADFQLPAHGSLYLVRLCISFSAHIRMILRGFSLLKRSLNLKSSLMYLSRFLNSLRVVLNTLMAHSVGINLLHSFSSSMLSGRKKIKSV